MLSASTNRQHPAFSGRPSDRHLTKADQGGLKPEELRLWSYQEPPLIVGSYSIKVSQDIATSSETINLPLQHEATLVVSAPKFRLPNKDDIHSVYPAPGHSDYCQTLAHVVFSHPTTPWGREGTPKVVGFNRVPWIGLLSFTEDELVLDAKSCQDAGFDKDIDKLSSYGTVSITAGRLEKNDKVSSPLDPGATSRDYEVADPVEVLLLRDETFGLLFTTSYGGDGAPVRSGPVDTGRFAMMAHVRETHGGFMASTDPAKAQPQFSVVVSPRTGPPSVSKPTRVVSHLISLEGLDKIKVAKNGKKYAGLVSLHSWDWMCIPPEQVDFGEVMRGLGHTLRPLRISDPNFEYKDGASSDWLHDILKCGYTLKRHTLETGEETMSLFRGPLIPVAPSRDMIQPFVASCKQLALTDKTTGIGDTSYSAAWNLGRSLAMADGTFTTSLLRLRGHIHSAAVKIAKAQALGENTLNRAAFLSAVQGSIQKLAEAHGSRQLANRGAHKRWVQTPKDQRRLPVERLSRASQHEASKYEAAAKMVMESYFGLGITPPDTDALAVRAWVVDKCYLATVPLHYLVPDPDMLPRESIRTFSIDVKWVDALIDGGLSLANHRTEGDDLLRRGIMDCVRTYVKNNDKVQIPKWGFLLRSIAVAAFPDLKVEAPWPPDSKQAETGLREVLYMQILTDDVLVCLFDRAPGDAGFTRITISQPPHQQCFAFGESLTPTKLKFAIRPIPLVPLEEKGGRPPRADPIHLTAVEINASDSKVDLYDWPARLIVPDKILQQYVDMPEQPTQVFKWKKEDPLPSSLLASQLCRPVLCMNLPIKELAAPPVPDKKDEHAQDKPVPPPTKTKRQPAAKPEDEKPDPGRVEPAPAALPRGPRDPVPLVRIEGNGGAVPAAAPHEVLESQKPDEEAAKATFSPSSQPLEASCMPLYDPGGPSDATIFALDTPIDLIFSLAFSQADTSIQGKHPTSLEVRIPIAFATAVQPAQSGSIAAMLLLPGSAAAPTLPRVESLNSNAQWIYTTHVVLGSLYELPEPPPAVGAPLNLKKQTTEAQPTTMLVVTLTPRFATGHMKDRFFDGSLILRRVLIARPDKWADSAQTQFDVRWTMPGERTPRAQPQKALLRRAVTVVLDHSGTYYNLDDDSVRVKAAVATGLAALQAELVLTAQPRAGGANVTVAMTPGGEGHTDEFSARLPSGRAHIPVAFRVGVRAKLESAKGGGGVGRRMGPESSTRTVPLLPRVGPMLGMYWAGTLRVIWGGGIPGEDPLSLAGVRLRFTVLTADETPASGADVVKEFPLNVPEAVLNEAALRANPSEGGERVQVLCEMVLPDEPRVRGIVWKDTLRFNLFPLQIRDGQFNFSSSQTVANHSSIVKIEGVFIKAFIDVFYVARDTEGKIWNARFGWNSELPSCSESQLFQSQSAASGALEVFHFGRVHDSLYRDQLHWIGTNGSIRTFERIEWESDVPSSSFAPWTLSGPPQFPPLFPNGSGACPNNGGSMVVSTQHLPAPPGETSSLSYTRWWVDPQGGICIDRWWSLDNALDSVFRTLPGLSRDASGGGAQTDGPRPSQLQTQFGDPHHSNVIWINPSGVLKVARVPLGDPTKGQTTAQCKDAVADANGSPACGLVAFTRKCWLSDGEPAADIDFAFWVSRNGAVWGAWSRGGGADWDTWVWTKFPVARPESAHLATRLRVFVRGAGDSGSVLVWFGLTGRLQAATWRDARRGGNPAVWSHALDVFNETISAKVDNDYVPELCVHEWQKDWDKTRRVQFFWVASSDAKLTTRTITTTG
ncbi:hypothetical protein B0T26DRAFT_753314 [Lasiosphaeria miniovina]|uniref:Uncharacterized protein n=1 Tax=Lasiosphaeria miniovina TaxID=1954250 RepID=A0AA40AC49_9PEZI|nr:uncharacterized protein B0T26DRAFT_753314 [Lasiosphaeria miniovina]KAK0713175.1 hypothetical protein B0T26DRAFT_753314 [Lasiosphaeria miniovina]